MGQADHRPNLRNLYLASWMALIGFGLAGCQVVLGLGEPDLAADAEICDDGLDNDRDGDVDCDDADCDCPPLTCGDGSVDGGEQCDDGNAANDDDCPTTCESARCGDGFLDRQQPVVEECDDGGESAACDLDCTAAACGDATVNATAGEQCDDGTAQSSAGCDADCTLPACGDGLFNPAAEECDDGGINTSTCDVDCTAPACGDGVFNDQSTNTPQGGLEECDDAGDSAACDSDCTLAACGDAFVNNAAGEQCDDGGDSAMCDADCTVSVCGDGFTNTVAGEQCDDGGINTSTCDADCTLPLCGDGFTNTAAGEQCDDGGESAQCDDDCTSPSCGDGNTNQTAGEQCDDGNTTSGDGCDAVCVAEGFPWDVARFPISIPGSPNGVGDLAFDAAGDLLVVTGNSREVRRVDRNTGAQSLIATGVGSGFLVGVTFRPSDGLIYAAPDNGQLFSIDAAGSVTLVGTLPGATNAVAVAAPGFGAFADHIIAVNTAGQVTAFDPASGASTVFATPGGNLSDLVFSNLGELFVVEFTGQVLRIDPAGASTVVATGLGGSDGIAIDNAGRRLFVADSGADALHVVDIATGLATVVGSFDFDSGFFVSGLIYDQFSTLIMSTGESSLTLQAITQ